jgi:RNA polymerase sigma factor (sigma-70 family)
MGAREADFLLVERVQSGDREAFGLLVSKYQRKLLRLVMRLVRDPAEAEDVTQEAFIKAYRALPNFRGESAFYTWLYRIGVNTAKNWLLSHGRRMPTVSEISDDETEGIEDGGAPAPRRDARSSAHVAADWRDCKRRHGGLAGGFADGHYPAGNRRIGVRRDRPGHGLSDWYGAFEDLSGARGDSGATAAAA